jgi:hypothetical protein
MGLSFLPGHYALGFYGWRPFEIHYLGRKMAEELLARTPRYMPRQIIE